jgi:hypothetical protein
MRVAEAYADADLSKIKEALSGGRLIIYSVGRPPSADHAITRSSELVSFTFASPAFGPDAEDGTLAPLFAENPAVAKHVGTPGFARALAADGSTVADFSVGTGGEILLEGVSATPDYPIKLLALRISLPAEKVEWTKTEFGHVFVTSADNAWRKVSVRG